VYGGLYSTSSNIIKESIEWKYNLW
jgi:hypothetical protein